ncbi:MAG: ABC transporter permease [Velocimicrobium sp.]
MDITQSFHLAIKSILSNRMRSILTMLGMIIGVASVILIMGLMKGVSKQVEESYSDMGINSISISVEKNGNRMVTEKDMYQFFDENRDLMKALSPLVETRFVAKNHGTKLTTPVKGVSETYGEIKTLTTKNGRFIDYADVLLRQNNCVIGTYVKDKLFGGEEGVGQKIKINGETFQVVGIINEVAGTKKGSSDDCIYISYSKELQMNKEVNVIEYETMAVDPKLADSLVAKLERWLYEKIGNRDNFYAFSMASMIQSMSSTMNMLALALSGIAGISLLVAGIGIMNIMLVSVSERTQEIGIRKSLGAKRRDILNQFIIEAGAVSGIGGIVGILVGIFFLIIARKLLNIEASPSLLSIVISFVVSVLTGIVFGYMPAKRAAMLNPIDALRGE